MEFEQNKFILEAYFRNSIDNDGVWAYSVEPCLDQFRKSSGRSPVAQDIVEDIRERIEDNPNISLRRLALQSKSTDLLLCSRLLF
jgi:hypothetical protein